MIGFVIALACGAAAVVGYLACVDITIVAMARKLAPARQRADRLQELADSIVSLERECEVGTYDKTEHRLFEEEQRLKELEWSMIIARHHANRDLNSEATK